MKDLPPKYFILIIVCLLCLEASCSSDSLLLKQKNEASYFSFTAGYRIPVNKNNIINSGHGLYLEGGINPGNLISRRTLIGLYIGFAFQDKLWATSFDQNFSQTYAASIDHENFSGIDSAIISSSAELFKTKKGTSRLQPGCETNSFHNYSMYYGLQFNLPLKYSPVIKVYKGTTRSYFQGDGSIATKEKDFNIFELRRDMYGFELFFSLTTLKRKDHLFKKIGLSIYAEYCDFRNGSLYFYDGTSKRDLKLSQFTDNSFREKYKAEIYSGVKLSFFVF